MSAGEITLGTVLRHMQGMELRLLERMDRMDMRMDRFEQRMDWIYRQLTAQIGALDKRLDEIESHYCQVVSVVSRNICI